MKKLESIDGTLSVLETKTKKTATKSSQHIHVELVAKESSHVILYFLTSWLVLLSIKLDLAGKMQLTLSLEFLFPKINGNFGLKTIGCKEWDFSDTSTFAQEASCQKVKNYVFSSSLNSLNFSNKMFKTYLIINIILLKRRKLSLREKSLEAKTKKKSKRKN